MKKSRKIYNHGFSLVELTVVMAVSLIIFLMAASLYNGYVKRATRQVCNANCVQFEGMYHVYLLMENKAHTAYVFNEFLQKHKHEGSICPANGEIKYVNGKVRCSLHFKNEANGIDDDGGVPFL